VGRNLTTNYSNEHGRIPSAGAAGSASILLAHFGILPECSEQMSRWETACFNYAAG